MLTRVHGRDDSTVQVSSMHDDVRVLIDSDIDGLPNCALTREELHDALVRAKAKAEDFIAVVESDIDATLP